MTPFFFFFTLCVSWSGGEDCSYTWEVINDRATFDNIFYVFFGESTKKENGIVTGFVNYPHKVVFVTPDRAVATLAHEARHVICKLEYTGTELEGCQFKIDEVYTVQAIRPENPTPIPENTMSGKMIETLGLIGEVINYNGNMKEGYE